MFQFLNDTTVIYGTLDWLCGYVMPEDIRRAVHTGACNLYHMCVHNAVHEKSSEMLKELLKSAAFTLRAKHYLETNVYVSKNVDLLAALQGEDLALLQDLLEKDLVEEFDEASRRLMVWAAKLIVQE